MTTPDTTTPGSSSRDTPSNTQSDNDDDDVCAICQYPLHEEQTITLTCSHIWHLSCLQQQLQHARPNPARRLVFSGIRCALCARVCQHPLIDELVQPAAHLLERVNALVAAQVRVDGLVEHRAVAMPDGPFAGDVLAYGRAYYAFFLCVLCEGPYLGGTIECVDGADVDLPPDDRLCPDCSPRATAVCVDVEHAPFHLWKCRLCCNVATFICHGSTHLCTDCHDRDALAQRHAEDPQQQRGRGPRQRDGHGLALAPTPCVGRPGCITPLPGGRTAHENGHSAACEQLLECVRCKSAPVDSRVLSDEERRSPNMLYNGDAAHGARGWTMGNATSAHSGMDSWETERSEHPFRDATFNFVTSYSWALMGQCVDLGRWVRRPSECVIEVSVRVRSRTDCAGEVRLEAAVLDDRLLPLGEREVSETLRAPPDYWERVRHVLMPREGARYVVVALMGKDTRFWSGCYGPKVTDCCVRVVYGGNVRVGHDEASVVDLEALQNVTEHTVGPSLAVHNMTVDRMRAQRMAARERQQQQGGRRAWWRG